jgi:basic amino acid/polyamine antiporter, APA family
MAVPRENELRRALSLPLIILYGVGTTIGAGIYVLVGEVAAVAGTMAPFSFLVAAVLAGLSAFTFAELCGRYPQSAGEAKYAQVAFRRTSLSTAVGLLVVAAGVISAATVIRGALGYLGEFVDLPPIPTILALTALLGLVAAWGILEAVGIAALLTLVELGGLVLVIWVGAPALALLPESLPSMTPDWQAASIVTVIAGGVVAFFAFIGFEDMVNVAEEVKDASRNLPIAIVTTLVVTTVLYVLVTVIAVLVVPLGELAGSDAPLARVLANSFSGAPQIISAISLVAVANGALIQMIMASRILYGLSRSGQLPKVFATVNRRTRTPLFATTVVVSVVALLAIALPLLSLAKAASIAILIVFATVNLALLVVKRRERGKDHAGFSVPLVVPLFGFIASTAIVLFEATRWVMALVAA